MERIILCGFLLLALLSSPVYAGAGISAEPLEKRTFFYEEGKIYTFTWHVFRAENLKAYLGGGLAQYTELIDPDPDGGPRDVTMKLILPQELSPGEHRLYLFVEEIVPGGPVGGVGGKARVGVSARFIALHPKPFVKAELTVENTAVNESTNAHMKLESWSQQTILPYVKYDIRDEKGVSVLQKTSARKTILPKETITITTPLDTSELPPGQYSAYAIVKDVQPGVNLTEYFRVGSFEIKLINYTKRMTLATFNRFLFTIESNWNGHIDDVYGGLDLLGREEKSSPVDLEEFEREELKVFMDLQNVTEPQLADGILTLYWGDEQKMFPVTINITEEPAGTEVTEAEMERAAFVFELNQITGIYLILVLLVIINVFVLLKKRKKNEEE